MNRIEPFLPTPKSLAKCRSLRLLKEAKAIEAIVGDVAMIGVPSVQRLLEGDTTINLWLSVEPDLAHAGDDLREWASIQLRGIARELLSAANRLYGGVD